MWPNPEETPWISPLPMRLLARNLSEICQTFPVWSIGGDFFQAKLLLVMEISFFPVITLKRSKVTWGFRIYIRLKSIKCVRILNQKNKPKSILIFHLCRLHTKRETGRSSFTKGNTKIFHIVLFALRKI